jgi:hypothetical protein
MSDLTCLSCQATTSNGLALCERCQQTLRVALVNVAAFHSDALRIRPGERVKVRSAYRSAPPPPTVPDFDPVTITTGYVDTIVTGWVRNLADDRPELNPYPGDTARACGWLEEHVTTIATLEWAGEFVREMVDCEQRLQRLIDRSDTGWYAGVCGNEIGREKAGDEVVTLTCPRNLYGTVGTSWVRCPECGRHWDAGQRREVMMRDARDEYAPVSVIARAVVGLVDEEMSVQRLANRIDQWVSRGRLHDLGVRVLADGKPHRVYRLGDVFDLMGMDVGDNGTSGAEAC